MTFSGHATIFSWMIITTSCCSVVWLGLVMIRCSVGLVSGYAHAFILLSVVIVTLPISPRVYMAEVQVCYGRWWRHRHSSNLAYLSHTLWHLIPMPCLFISSTTSTRNLQRSDILLELLSPWTSWGQNVPNHNVDRGDDVVAARAYRLIAYITSRWHFVAITTWLIIIESDVDIACRTGGNIFVRKFIKKWLTSWRTTHFPLQPYRYDNIILDTRALPLKISVTVTVSIWFQMHPLQRDRRRITLLM